MATRIDEVAEGIYRINTPIEIPGGPDKFSFNQYLIADDEALLFHSGPRQLFPVVREAVGRVMPVERLRWIGLSHFEADECTGATLERLAREAPTTLACMHGSAWRGDGAALLRALAAELQSRS